MDVTEAEPERSRRRAWRAAQPPVGLLRLLGRPRRLLLFAFGRFTGARGLVRRVAGRLHPVPAPLARAGQGPLTSLPPGLVLERLRRDGICTGLRLPPDLLAELRAHAEASPCYGGPDWTLPIEPWDHEAAERRHGLRLPAGAVPEPERHCPKLAALIRDPWLQALADAYLGARAQLIDLRLWWSFPSPDAQPGELKRVAQDSFHFDLGDWNQLKLFFYLTDVDEMSGAHVYARGSHRGRPLRDQASPFSSRSPQAVAALAGAGAIEVITGPAGTGFAEDPFGYHTGLAVRRGRRLILELSFGISATTRRRDYAAPPG